MTDTEVGAAVATGADSVRAIRRSTGAGSSCGSCVKRLSCLLAAARNDADSPTAVTVPVSVPVPVPPQPAWRGHLAACPAAVPALG